MNFVFKDKVNLLFENEGFALPGHTLHVVHLATLLAAFAVKTNHQVRQVFRQVRYV